MLVEVPNWLLLLPTELFRKVLVYGSMIYMGMYLIIILISKMFDVSSSYCNSCNCSVSQKD